MFYLSNRKLRLLIISLLLLIFSMFLGIFTTKAEMIGIEPSSYYCPGGSSWQQIHNDKWYYGCSGNNSNFFKTTLTYDFGSDFTPGYYDLSGYIYTYRTIHNIYTNVGGTSCFITNNVYSTGTFGQPSPMFLNFYCFNVYIQNPRQFNIDVEGNSNDTTGQVGIGRELTVNTHFDKSINANIGTITDNSTDIKNAINDSNVDSNGASSSASTWNSKNATNGTITNLLTLPIQLLQHFVNGMQTSCSTLNLGSLFGTNLTLPCINISDYLGSTLTTTIDLLFSGFMILSMAKKLIKIFNDFTNLKSNQIDELYGGGGK